MKAAISSFTFSLSSATIIQELWFSPIVPYCSKAFNLFIVCLIQRSICAFRIQFYYCHSQNSTHHEPSPIHHHDQPHKPFRPSSKYPTIRPPPPSHHGTLPNRATTARIQPQPHLLHTFQAQPTPSRPQEPPTNATMNNLYYLPVPTYNYPNSAPAMYTYSALPTLQCQETCCVATPVMYAPVASACNLSCCSGSPPDIIINNPGNNPITINNSGGGCADSCCSPVASTCTLACCSGGGMGGVGGQFACGYPGAYEDTCNTTSSYYYSAGPSARYNKTPKSYYTSYGNGGCMMM